MGYKRGYFKRGPILYEGYFLARKILKSRSQFGVISTRLFLVY